MLWIRISTGQLCIEVNEKEVQDPTSIPWTTSSNSNLGIHLTSDSDVEQILLSTASLDDIHNIFSASTRWDSIHIADSGTILLGSLSWPMASGAHLFNPFTEVPLLDGLGLLDVGVERWEYVDSTPWGTSSWTEGLIMLSNGWTWYDSLFF
jgi:hypothetical protein